MFTQPLGAMFHEEQRFRQPWLQGLMFVQLLLLWGIAAWIIIQQLILKKPAGNNPVSDSGALVLAIVLIVGGALTPAILWLLRLQVQVGDDGVSIRFWPLPGRLIRFDQIAQCYARTYSPIGEYGGWGIRWGWTGGRAYNVSGNRGVQLELLGGKRVLLGSQQSEELAAAICSRLPRGSATKPR